MYHVTNISNVLSNTSSFQTLSKLVKHGLHRLSGQIHIAENGVVVRLSLLNASKTGLHTEWW